MTDIVPSSCRSCPAYNATGTHEYAHWCVDRNESILRAIRACNPAFVKAQWASVMRPNKKAA